LLSLLFFTDDVKQLRKKNKKLFKTCSIQTNASYLGDMAEHLCLMSTTTRTLPNTSISSLPTTDCNENLLNNNDDDEMIMTVNGDVRASRDHSPTPSTNESSSNSFMKKTKAIRGKKRRRRGRKH
jgi:hypothetical protein